MYFVAILFNFLLLNSVVFAAPAAKRNTDNGVVFICSDRTGEIKMTADLVSQPGQKLAVIAEIGSQELFPEKVGKVLKHRFVLHPSKTALLEIQKAGSKRPVLRLEIDPENSHAVVAQEHEGVKIIKLDAFLTAPQAELVREPVSCLETSWK
jgi:hypothetical protein